MNTNFWTKCARTKFKMVKRRIYICLEMMWYVPNAIATVCFFFPECRWCVYKVKSFEAYSSGVNTWAYFVKPHIDLLDGFWIDLLCQILLISLFKYVCVHWSDILCVSTFDSVRFDSIQQGSKCYVYSNKGVSTTKDASTHSHLYIWINHASETRFMMQSQSEWWLKTELNNECRDV